MCMPEKRVVHVEELAPEICSLDVATMNFNQHVFLNHPVHLAIMANRILAAGTKPELEVFDTGHIVLARKMIDDGLIASPPYFQFCLGISYGAPASVESMLLMRICCRLGRLVSLWHLASPVSDCGGSGAVCGNVRVGLEDNIFLDKGCWLRRMPRLLIRRHLSLPRLVGRCHGC